MTKEREKRVIRSCDSSSCGSTESFDEGKETEMDEIGIRQTVRDRYAEVAKTGRFPGLDDLPDIPEGESSIMGYSEEEEQSIPEGSNLGLGSGNPVALASIKPGEIVVDLGSGAGVDCFLAAQKTGATGKVIGVDMTPEMIDRARTKAKQGDYKNVEFRLGEIEHMPVADSSADVIISNCVINLALDKAQVFRDAYRVLKPGGRIMISDLLIEEEFPEVVKNALAGTAGCVSNALQKDEYLEIIRAAGFDDVKVVNQVNIPRRKREEKKEFEEVGTSQEAAPEKRKAMMVVDGHKVELELTPEEAKRLENAIVSAHISAIKPKQKIN